MSIHLVNLLTTLLKTIHLVEIMNLLNPEQAKKRVVTNISSKQRRSIFNSLQHIICFSMLWCYCISYYHLNSEQRKKAFISSVSVLSRTLTINSDQVKEQRIGCRMQVSVTRLMKGHTYCFKEKTYWNQRWTMFVFTCLENETIKNHKHVLVFAYSIPDFECCPYLWKVEVNMMQQDKIVLVSSLNLICHYNSVSQHYNYLIWLNK